MKTFLKALLFLLSFQTEVRVKAASEGGVFFAGKQPFHLREKDLKMHAAAGSALEKMKNGDWKVLHGDVWVERAQHNNFETLYLAAKGGSGEYWISAQEGKTWIRNFSAVLKVTLRDGKTLDIPPGFQMWAAGFNSDARVEYGMIEPIDMRAQIPRWYEIYPDGEKSFRQKMESLKSSWGDTVETGSEIYRAQTMRKIAAAEESQKASIDRKHRADEEKRRLRRFYMQRTFER